MFLTGFVRSSWSAVVAPGAGSKGYPALTIFHIVNAGCALVTSPGSSVQQAPIALTGRERGVLVREGVCLTRECGEIIALRRGAEASHLAERKGRRTRCSQDPRRILGTIAEPTGTDGFPVLCHQFAPSSLHRRAHCITRFSTCEASEEPVEGSPPPAVIKQWRPGPKQPADALLASQ